MPKKEEKPDPETEALSKRSPQVDIEAGIPTTTHRITDQTI